MKKKNEDVAFPRIITTNKRLKQLKREAKQNGVSVKFYVEALFKGLDALDLKSLEDLQKVKKA